VPQSLAVEIRDALNQARKDRDKGATVLYSSILSDIRNREIETGGEADDNLIREVIDRGVRQRREAATQMRDGGREELAAKEEKEIELLSRFLPPPMEEDEVRELVRRLRAEGVEQVGPLMGRLVPLIRGRFDGGEANRIVREELAG
jgi:uncharacterized protein YqeY